MKKQYYPTGEQILSWEYKTIKQSTKIKTNKQKQKQKQNKTKQKTKTKK